VVGKGLASTGTEKRLSRIDSAVKSYDQEDISKNVSNGRTTQFVFDQTKPASIDSDDI